MSTVNANVTPGKVFTEDAEGKVQVTPDGLNLLGVPTVTVPLDDSVATADIQDEAVTNAKLADMAVSTIKGRSTAGTGVPQDCTAAQIRAILGIGVPGAEFTVAADAMTLTAGGIAQAKLTAASLDQTVVKVLADSAVLGGIPVIFRIPVPAGTTGNVDVTLTLKTRVIDAWLVKTNGAGGGAGTIQVFNATNAITDAMSINIADTTIARALTINDANHEIAAAGTLRITRTRTASTDETCIVYVKGISIT